MIFRLHILIVFLVTILCPALGQSLVPTDDGSRIEFKIKNFGATVEGSFTGLQGKIQFDPTMPDNAHFDVTVDTNTIDTGIGLRDNHLRKEDYFNVRQFPRIRFLSTKVTHSSRTGEFILTGNLTVKDTTREISFPFTYSNDGIFKGQFEINRRDYHLGGNSISMADKITVHLSIKAITRV